MSSLVSSGVRSVARKITRSALETRTSRPPASTNASAPAIHGSSTRTASALAGRLAVRCSYGLRFRGSALAQVDREDAHRRNREELRLPVLKRALPEVGAGEVPGPRQRWLQMRNAVVAVFGPARDRLAEPRAQPYEAHHDHQRVRVDVRA